MMFLVTASWLSKNQITGIDVTQINWAGTKRLRLQGRIELKALPCQCINSSPSLKFTIFFNDQVLSQSWHNIHSRATVHLLISFHILSLLLSASCIRHVSCISPLFISTRALFGWLTTSSCVRRPWWFLWTLNALWPIRTSWLKRSNLATGGRVQDNSPLSLKGASLWRVGTLDWFKKYDPETICENITLRCESRSTWQTRSIFVVNKDVDSISDHTN